MQPWRSRTPTSQLRPWSHFLHSPSPTTSPGSMPRPRAAATAVTTPPGGGAALGGVPVRLPVDQQATVVADALAAASTLTDPAAYAEILADLAPHLGPDQLDQALAAAVSATT